MKKDPVIFIKHMYDAIVDIEKFVDGISEDVFYRDQKTQYAVLKALEIIGEAAKNLPEDFKSVHSEVLWRAISDAKNVFVHEYFDVDLNLVWQIIKGDLLELKKQLQSIKNL